MGPSMHHDYRQQPIVTDEACRQYHQYLSQLEAMIAAQEDVVAALRVRGDSGQLARERTSLWRLLTKRQGVIDAINAYEQGRARQQ